MSEVYDSSYSISINLFMSHTCFHYSYNTGSKKRELNEQTQQTLSPLWRSDLGLEARTQANPTISSSYPRISLSLQFLKP